MSNRGFAAKIEEELFSTFESSHSYEIMYYYYELFSQVFRGEGHSGSECTTTGAVPSSVYPTIIASNNSPRRRRRRRNNNNNNNNESKGLSAKGHIFLRKMINDILMISYYYIRGQSLNPFNLGPGSKGCPFHFMSFNGACVLARFRHKLLLFSLRLTQNLPYFLVENLTKSRIQKEPVVSQSRGVHFISVLFLFTFHMSPHVLDTTN